MKYRVWFTFRNALGALVKDYLDNNGEGFTQEDAADIARQLLAQGHDSVKVKPIPRIEFRGRVWEFRECDAGNMSEAALIYKADNSGKIQYEAGNAWLVVPGVGYGWEVK